MRWSSADARVAENDSSLEQSSWICPFRMYLSSQPFLLSFTPFFFDLYEQAVTSMKALLSLSFLLALSRPHKNSINHVPHPSTLCQDSRCTHVLFVTHHSLNIRHPCVFAPKIRWCLVSSDCNNNNNKYFYPSWSRQDTPPFLSLVHPELHSCATRHARALLLLLKSTNVRKGLSRWANSKRFFSSRSRRT